MKKLTTFIISLAMMSTVLMAQFSLTTVGTPVTEDFNTYTSAGIQPVAGAGELSSNSFAFTGFSDGAVAFGGTNLTGDYARGLRYSTTPVATGGLYAYTDTLAGDNKLWIQPTGGDFTPGEVYMRIVNNTGAVLNDVDIALELTVFNDSIPNMGNTPTRSQNISLAFSTDSLTYFVIASDTTPGLGDGIYYTIPLAFTLNALNLADGQSMFLRFSADDHSGLGSRDELGLDNLSFTALPPSANATVTFGTNLTSVPENVGNTMLTINQTFAAACSVDVVVTGGTATNGTDYTFAQTVIFDGVTPSSMLDITIFDDVIVEPTEDATMILTNATAGCQVSILGSTLEILDDEIGIDFAQGTISTNEGAVSFNIDINQTTATACSVEVALVGGTATNPADLSFTSPQVIVFDGITPTQSIAIPLIDDALVEGAETAIFLLQNPTGGCVVGATANTTATIDDNDFPIYPIGLVTTQDANGSPDSLGVTCRLQGTVYGVNYRAGLNALQFTLRDGTGSIWALSAFQPQPLNFGYTVNEGDSVEVQGTIVQAGGSTQINLDTVILLPTPGIVLPPTVVTSFVEANEADLIKVNNFYFVDLAQWTNGPNSFPVQITNGTDTLLIRIDNDIDAFNMPAPICSSINVTGLLNQYDNTSPYTTAYQLLPRYMADIECTTPPDINITTPSTTVTESVGSVNATVSITNPLGTATTVDVAVTGTATFGTDYTITPPPTGGTITFPGGSSTPITFAVNIVDDAINEGTETITFTLSNATNNAQIGNGTMTITIDDNDVAVADGIPVNSVKVFPNPGNTTFTIKTDEQVTAIEVFNSVGQTVLTSGTVNTPISTAHLANAVYTVRVITSKGSWMTKWVKQ